MDSKVSIKTINGNIFIKLALGDTLRLHADRPFTHVLSAVINVDQMIDEQWPFVAFDHSGRRREIYLNETIDMILYESATVIHGRPNPLVGNTYANLFVHFAPTG